MQRAQREAERLGRTRLQQIGREARQAGRAVWSAFRAASEDARRALERIDDTRFREVVRRAQDAADRIGRAFRNVRDSDRLGTSFSRLGRTLLGVAGAAAAVGALGSALSGLVAAAAAVVGVLAPTVEILAGLPEAALLAGAAVGTLRLALAEALLKAGRQTINDLNSTQAGINKAAQSLGKNSADLLYDSGKKAGQGFLEGLKAQQEEIRKLMEKIARPVAETVKRTLKTKSPSRVMAGLGEDTLAGYLAGLEQLAPQIAHSLQRALDLPGVAVPAPGSTGSARRSSRRSRPPRAWA